MNEKIVEFNEDKKQKPTLKIDNVFEKIDVKINNKKSLIDPDEFIEIPSKKIDELSDSDPSEDEALPKSKTKKIHIKTSKNKPDIGEMPITFKSHQLSFKFDKMYNDLSHHFFRDNMPFPLWELVSDYEIEIRKMINYPMSRRSYVDHIVKICGGNIKGCLEKFKSSCVKEIIDILDKNITDIEKFQLIYDVGI